MFTSCAKFGKLPQAMTINCEVSLQIIMQIYNAVQLEKLALLNRLNLAHSLRWLKPAASPTALLLKSVHMSSKASASQAQS